MANQLTELEKRIKEYDREFVECSLASFEASRRNDAEQQLKWANAALRSAAKRRQARRELAKLKDFQCDGACTQPDATSFSRGQRPTTSGL